MIKIFCDHCGKELDSVKFAIFFSEINESRNKFNDNKNFMSDLCQTCFQELRKFFN